MRVSRAGILPAGDFADLADHAVGDIAMGFVALGLRAALGADLDRDVVRLGGGGHGLAFFDGAAGGFFDIDMLAAFGCVHRLDRVPVIGGGNDHGVDVFAGDQFAVIAVRRGAGSSAGGLGQAAFVHVAQGDDLSLI